MYDKNDTQENQEREQQVKNTFAARLYKMRTDMHLTQDKLAERIGVNRQTVSAWENAKTAPTITALADLCSLSGYDLNFFMGKQETKRNDTKDVAPLIGLSETATDELLVMSETKNYLLPLLSKMIENQKLLQDIYSAAASNYRDGILEQPEKERMFVSADLLYSAEKTAVFEELMKFIDDLRKNFPEDMQA